MWLIYVGYWLRNKAKLQFDNAWICGTCALLFVHFCMTQPKGVDLNGNIFADVITLTIATICALYIICFFSQKIQGKMVGNVLRYCGEESFYIMALQFVGFKIGIYCLNALGFDMNIGALTAPTMGKWYLVIAFTLFGVIVPLVAMWCFRWLKCGVLYIVNKNK